MDTEKIIVDTCSNLLIGMAEQEKIASQHVGVRIDLENKKSKPILSLFDKAKFLKRINIKDLAKASGVGAMSGLISMSIQKIVHSIFNYGFEQYELTTTKEMFILIQLKIQKGQSNTSTSIALYIKGQMEESKLLSEILSQAQNG